MVSAACANSGDDLQKDLKLVEMSEANFDIGGMPITSLSLRLLADTKLRRSIELLLQSAQIPGVEAEGLGFEESAHDFSASRLGELFHEDQLAGSGDRP